MKSSFNDKQLVQLHSMHHMIHWTWQHLLCLIRKKGIVYLRPWCSFCRGFWLVWWTFQMFGSLRPGSRCFVSAPTRGRCLTRKCLATLVPPICSLAADGNDGLKLLPWILNREMLDAAMLPEHRTLCVYSMCWDRRTHANFWRESQSTPTNSFALLYSNAHLVMRSEISRMLKYKAKRLDTF